MREREFLNKDNCINCKYITFEKDNQYHCSVLKIPIDKYGTCGGFDKREVAKNKENVNTRRTIIVFLALLFAFSKPLLKLVQMNEKSNYDNFLENTYKYGFNYIKHQGYYPSQDTLSLKRVINIYYTDDVKYSYDIFFNNVVSYSYEDLKLFEDNERIFMDNILLKYNMDSTFVKLHHIIGIARKTNTGRHFKKVKFINTSK